jgi:hypothetical protein
MTTETLLPFGYDNLRTCPFCGGTNLMSAACDRYLILEQCPHFVVAFENGVWGHDICPPVTCNGFLFDQKKLEEAAAQIDDVVMKVKPGTRRHPRITAIYCGHPGAASKLRENIRRPVNSAPCGECGNTTAVIGDLDEILCARCGVPSDLPKDLAED